MRSHDFWSGQLKSPRWDSAPICSKCSTDPTALTPIFPTFNKCSTDQCAPNLKVVFDNSQRGCIRFFLSFWNDHRKTNYSKRVRRVIIRFSRWTPFYRCVNCQIMWVRVKSVFWPCSNEANTKKEKNEKLKIKTPRFIYFIWAARIFDKILYWQARMRREVGFDSNLKTSGKSIEKGFCIELDKVEYSQIRNTLKYGNWW